MKDAPYSLMLLSRNDGEAQQAARLLDSAKLVYDRANVDYWEPRLRIRIGDERPTEVIGIAEIKEVIPYILEEVEKQQAA